MIFEYFAKKLFSYDDKEGLKKLRANYKAFLNGLILFPLNIPGTAYYACMQGRKNVVKVIKDVFKERKQSQVPRHDFLDHLLEEVKKEGTFLTEEIAMDLVFMLLFATYETTSTAVTFATKFLADHPSTLAELTKEHGTILRSRESEESEMTWEEYKSMTFTHMIINETVRLANIAPMILRRVTKDVELKVDGRGFARFVNIRDKNGATPLHLAARQGWPECVHMLLDSGALVCASTGGYGYPGITPLHFAARGGSLDCVRELLAWGADRLHRDSSGRIPYMVALRHKHAACAALLNPSAPEPLIWPSPLKFITELNPEAKALLERALMETNKEREKTILRATVYSLPSPLHSEAEAGDNMSQASDVDLCCICFDQVCTIEVQTCGHQMCANCTLALCCHNKPNPTTLAPKAPVCPFCRSNITQLVVAKIKTKNDKEFEFSPSKPRISRKSFNTSEESSSFKGLSAMSSFGKLGGRSSGKVAAECDDEVDKL